MLGKDNGLFEQISNDQYHLSLFACEWQNTLQQGVDIFQKKIFLKDLKY